MPNIAFSLAVVAAILIMDVLEPAWTWGRAGEVRGVCYDAGVVMGVNWRPHFDPNTARREMEIIRDELHCTAVRIGARDVGRLMTAAEAALDADLDVWLSPALWDRDADETQAYIERAAEVAERLRQRAPDRVMLVVGGELTLFMRGSVDLDRSPPSVQTRLGVTTEVGFRSSGRCDSRDTSLLPPPPKTPVPTSCRKRAQRCRGR